MLRFTSLILFDPCFRCSILSPFCHFQDKEYPIHTASKLNASGSLKMLITQGSDFNIPQKVYVFIVLQLSLACFYFLHCLWLLYSYTTKNENFQIKNSGIFHISAQNIDCGYSLEPPRQGGSNEYPQSMFWSRNKQHNITKTYLYNFDPLKPHFYIVKLGFTGVYIIFFIAAQTIDCGYSLEPPHRGGSNEYPQSMFLSINMKIIRVFYL